MGLEQENEWTEAQKIVASVDLVDAAKRQLQFLAAVDRNRYLYDGPALQWAIYRYNVYWLPLLAKHSKSPLCERPLVVPLDCEWIWHCHRLNPVQYKSDCESLFGRILDNCNVLSSIQEPYKGQTEQIWSRMYPEEPYDLDLINALSENIPPKLSEDQKFTGYDLVSAVQRQAPFFYQVDRAHMSSDIFLQEAVARYKGFLHLIKRNKQKSIRRFCVPTYDIDLIWHSHQLHPVSYSKDLIEILGKVLEHDDTDSDRTKGKKLDTGFSDTTKQWEETFGSRYWKAGAMYKGTAPSPVTDTPCPFNVVGKKLNGQHECQGLFQPPEVKVVEVLLEFLEIKNLPVGHKGSLFVSFCKKQPDLIFDMKRRLSIFSEYGEKQVAFFQCEPSGELLFELVSRSPLNVPLTRSYKTIGSASFSLQKFLDPVSKLSVDKWLELIPPSGTISSEPILLHFAASFSIPTPAIQILHMVRSQPLSESACFFPLPGRVNHVKSWTRVIDDAGNDVISLQMRSASKDKIKSNPASEREVIGSTGSGEIQNIAQFAGNQWSIRGSWGRFQLLKKSGNDSHLFELIGDKMVKLYSGRRLEYEPKHYEKPRSDKDFVTAVEFSAAYPYGRAIALIDFRSGTIKVKDDWFVLPGITLAFILSDILRKEGYKSFAGERGELKNEFQKITTMKTEVETNEDVANGNKKDLEGGLASKTAMGSGGCGGGCGSGCGGGCRSIKSSGCGGCGGGCGGRCSTMKSSGCGGCGGGCGGGCSTVKSGGCGGCGGSCGGGCGKLVGAKNSN